MASIERHDEIAGTATHLTAFLLVERDQGWGTSVLKDSALPPEVRGHLGTEPGVKVLLTRRHRREHRTGGLRVMVAVPRTGTLVTRELQGPEELLTLDLAAIAGGRVPDWEHEPGSVYGICTHGRHDVCCAERGRPVAAAFDAVAAGCTWEVSHLGGDRFAGNLVILPHGLYYGRVGAADAPRLLAAHDAGRLDLDHFRGRSSYPMPVQYAEIALRRHLREDRIDALRLIHRRGGRTRWRRDGEDYEVVVRSGSVDTGLLTCGASRPQPIPQHVVETITRV